MRSNSPVLVLFLAATFLGCRGGGFVLDPDEADEEIGLPGSSGREFGATSAYEHVARGEVLFARGDLGGAAIEFEVALASDPGDFYLRAQLAELYIKLDELERARGHIEKILKRDQSNELAWIALAKYHKAGGKAGKAVKAARRAMRVEPKSLEAPLWLARYYEDSGDLERSVEILRGASLAHPNKAELRLELAEVLLTLGRDFEAREHLEVFVRLRPMRADAIKKIAEISLAAGDKMGAQELLEFALSKDPSDAEMRLSLIYLQLELGLRERAALHLDSLPPIRGGDLEGFVKRACLFARAGETYRARNYLTDQFGTRPTEPLAVLALAEIEVELGRLETAKLLVETTDDKWTSSELSYKDALQSRIPDWPDGTEPCGFLKE